MEDQITDMSKDFKEGNKVHYAASHIGKTEPLTKWNTENGIVKSVSDGGVFVVYKCGNDWANYKNYTAACTDPSDLRHGWL